MNKKSTINREEQLGKVEELVSGAITSIDNAHRLTVELKLDAVRAAQLIIYYQDLRGALEQYQSAVKELKK